MALGQRDTEWEVPPAPPEAGAPSPVFTALFLVERMIFPLPSSVFSQSSFFPLLFPSPTPPLVGLCVHLGPLVGGEVFSLSAMTHVKITVGH